MRNTEILVSGGGIAGAALAYWLRAAGFTVTVVERAPGPRPGGQTVDLRGAGREVVARMGLMDQARAVAVDQEGMALVDAKGRVKATMPVDAFGGEGIISEIEILRGDLARVLYEATLPDTEYVFDDTIIGLDQDDDGVTVTFEKAHSRRFGLVVGADGTHSVVRALAFAPESDCVRPLDVYNAWFTTTDAMELGGWYKMFNAPGGLVASARPGRLPGEVKAALAFRSPPLVYDRSDLGAQRALVASRFAGVTGWEVPRLLRGMETASDFFFESMGQVHLDGWSRGRVALIGDAGHCPTPLTGLGTSLALVGAYVLAGELATTGDHRAAFARYDEIMRPYVTEAQKLPPGGASGFAPSSALAIRMRAASMRSMTRWPMRSLIAAQFAKAGNITLPDYRPLAVR
ncbi:FAD-dependent monooxygenase [Actinoallomurus iriomotensis]|uniref:Monooxygenase n=1 Tax=Actinoallomurus iriomotensis TaxID=478107 RepID=A0A9W6RRJ9_9ACTN|nr:FAD-dependent monooxygenase [Actinoallomurus iriomotensis]GLY80641.1 monooxygenase [Actinoallomurus iriomotensis]